MAISVSVPKEITEYKSKIFFGLSGRQFVTFVASAGLAVGIGCLCYFGLGISIETTGNIIIVAVLPLASFGFIRPHNMPLERYLGLLCRHYFGKNVLPYETELLLDTFRAQKQLVEGESEERSNRADGKRKKAARRGRRGENPEILQSVSGRAKGFTAGRRQRKKKVQSAKQKIKGARREVRALRKQAKKAGRQGGA